MASASDESPVQTDEEHRAWAHEHLLYEADTLVFAMREIPKLKAKSPQMAFAIESWAVHVRCLDDFLWGSRKQNFPGDAFATDFCKPGVWKEKRGEVPPTLQQIRSDRRIGREIVHLSYHRASVSPDEKTWLISDGTNEILAVLNLFADTARAELLMDETRDRLRALHSKYGSAASTPGMRVATGYRVTAGTAAHDPPP